MRSRTRRRRPHRAGSFTARTVAAAAAGLVGSPAGPARRIGAVDVPSGQPGTERPLLTVVVPVYNGGDEIVGNVEQIREVITRELPGQLEVVVVSDGSIDGTAERLLERRSDAIRVIHYDRNLGKGYAVKLGALGARGH